MTRSPSSIDRRVRASILLTGILVLLLPPPPLGAQSARTIDLDRFTRCEGCIDTMVVVELGTEAPPGVIRHEAARVQIDPASGLYAIWVRSRPEVDIFSPSGAYLRTIGPRGEGPGELESVTALRISDGELFIWDSRAQRLTRFDLSSDAFRTTPFPGLRLVNALDFEVADSTTLVFGTALLSPDAVGYPLHVVELDGDQARLTRRTGSVSGDWNAAEPWGRRILTSAGNHTSVWRAAPARLHFQEWTADDRQLAVVSGEPDWFPPVVEYPPPGDPPAVHLLDFLVDAGGVIWTLSRIPDREGWRQGIGDRTDGQVPIIQDPDSFYDIRLDAFDLEVRLHSGPLFFDEASAELVDVDGVAHLNRVIYDREMVPRIRLVRLESRAR